MIKGIIIVGCLLVIASYLISCGGKTTQQSTNPMNIKAIDNTAQYPTIDEAFIALDSLLTDSAKTEIKAMSEEDFLVTSHFEIGMYIRNNWIRQGKLHFTSDWLDKGPRHIDDISSIILTSYYRYLTGEDISLKGQLNTYKDYYKIHALPPKSEYPEEVKKMGAWTEAKKSYEENTLHILRNKEKDNDIWLYNYQYGWIKVDQTVLDKIEEKNPLNDEYVAEIFKNNSSKG